MSSLVRFLFTLAAAIAAASLLVASLRRRAPPPGLPAKLVPSSHMAARNRSFVLWLHGLGDSGPANEPIRNLFSAPEFRLAKWSFPSAPRAPVSCNNGFVMPSWFDIHELPMNAGSPQDEAGVLKAVEKVHAMIDSEVADGIHPENIFVCGFSQGGALTLASVLLYPKKLGGGAVFSGWVPFSSSVTEKISPDARKAINTFIPFYLWNTAGSQEPPLIPVWPPPETIMYLKTPFLWSHGMADKVVLFEAGQAGPPFLQSAGVNCEFKAYPDLGHSLSKEELLYLESWIKSRLNASQEKEG